MAGLVSTSITSGATALLRVVPFEAKIGLRTWEKASRLKAAALLTPRKSANEHSADHTRSLKLRECRLFIHNLARRSSGLKFRIIRFGRPINCNTFNCQPNLRMAGKFQLI
jgi:hypothetical protein